MPIYELGYRQWNGERRPAAMRWWPITRTGIQLAWRNAWLKRLMFVAWWPMIVFAIMFLMVGWATEPGNLTSNGPAAGLTLGTLGLGPADGAALLGDPARLRPIAWSVLFHRFLAYPQIMIAFLVVTMVGPPLIARDTRMKAYLIYFSKPIGFSDYLIGKTGTVVFFLFCLTLFPSLVLYVVSLGFAPSLGAFVDTFPIIFKLIAASAVLCIPVALLVLTLSSFAADERVATLTWIGVFFFGEAATSILSGSDPGGWYSFLSVRWAALDVVNDLFNVNGELRALGSNFQMPGGHAMPALTFLVLLSVACVLILRYRVTAPVRI